MRTFWPARKVLTQFKHIPVLTMPYLQHTQTHKDLEEEQTCHTYITSFVTFKVFSLYSLNKERINIHLSPHAFHPASRTGLHGHRSDRGRRSGRGRGRHSDRGHRNGRRYLDCRHNRGESHCQRLDDLLHRHESQNLEGYSGNKHFKLKMKM